MAPGRCHTTGIEFSDTWVDVVAGAIGVCIGLTRTSALAEGVKLVPSQSQSPAGCRLRHIHRQGRCRHSRSLRQGCRHRHRCHTRQGRCPSQSQSPSGMSASTLEWLLVRCTRHKRQALRHMGRRRRRCRRRRTASRTTAFSEGVKLVSSQSRSQRGCRHRHRYRTRQGRFRHSAVACGMSAHPLRSPGPLHTPRRQALQHMGRRRRRRQRLHRLTRPALAEGVKLVAFAVAVSGRDAVTATDATLVKDVAVTVAISFRDVAHVHS